MKAPVKTDTVLDYTPSAVGWATAELIRKPPSTIATATVVFFVTGMLLALAYSWFSVIPVTVDVEGTLINDRKTYPIVTMANGTVAQLMVEENELVKIGQPLVRTNAVLSKSDFKVLSRQISELETLLKLDSQNKCSKSCAASVRLASSRYFSFVVASPLKEQLAQIQELNQSYSVALDKRVNVRAQMTEQYAAMASARRKLEVIRQKNAEAILAVEVDGLKRELVNLSGIVRDKTAAIVENHSAARDRLATRLSNLRKEIDDFQKYNELRAPVAGRVQNLTVSGPGMILPAGQKIMDLIPVDTKLVAEVSVPNADISKVAQGMPALISINALPETEYGLVNGKLLELPPNVAAATNPTAPLNYQVRIVLDRQKFTLKNQDFHFKLGMTVKALIIEKRERLLLHWIKKILRIKDDIFGS